jgi:hypothetical protein
VDNDKKLIRQVQIGKFFSQSISSVYSPINGISISNSPTSVKKAFGYYTISDMTEPDWLVELYINGELVDFTRADASGLYVFRIPLAYGNTTITRKFYGPAGEERTENRTISVPYNFLPAGKFEYRLNAGVLESSGDWKEIWEFAAS